MSKQESFIESAYDHIKYEKKTYNKIENTDINKLINHCLDIIDINNIDKSYIKYDAEELKIILNNYNIEKNSDYTNVACDDKELYTECIYVIENYKDKINNNKLGTELWRYVDNEGLRFIKLNQDNNKYYLYINDIYVGWKYKKDTTFDNMTFEAYAITYGGIKKYIRTIEECNEKLKFNFDDGALKINSIIYGIHENDKEVA